MSAELTDTVLDRILLAQLRVAFAGERCEPPRLGWWSTDLVDDLGGRDLFARLLPRTAEWALLVSVREAARRTDARARGVLADPDRLRTVFHLGFTLDERLDDRLADLRRSGTSPTTALPGLDTDAAFDREAFTGWLGAQSPAPRLDVVPGGRQLKGPPPDAPDALVARLVAALAPLAEQYPLPFYRVER